MSDDKFDMTKLRLSGKVTPLDYDLEDDPEEVEDTALLDAITALTESVKQIGNAKTTVDMTPVLQGIQEIRDRVVKKREWRFDVKLNDDGDIESIKATEV